MRRPWNAFDALLVVAGYASLIATNTGGNSLQAMRVLRVLRALRPLRVINVSQVLRSMVGCFREVSTPTSAATVTSTIPLQLPCLLI